MPLLSDEEVFGTAAPGGLLSDEDVFGASLPKAVPPARSTRAGIADYLNAANTALATGVVNIGASAGTVLQDPGGAIVSGALGARAGLDRGMTALINAFDPEAPAVPHTATQRAAQVAAEVAADRRAANAAEPWNVPARMGKFMEEDSRRVAAELQAQERSENPALVAQQEDMAKAQGFTGNLKAAVQNPLATFHTLARSAPDMALGVGMGATVARAGGGIGAVSAAGTASEAASSGMQAREGTYQQVAGMPLEQLANSPRFQEIAQAVGDPVRAREILANELADQTPLLSAAGTAAGTLLTNRLFGGDATAKTIMGGERMTARELGRRVAQDTVEEGLQGVPEDTVQHGAEVQADPSKEWDPGGSLAQNMVAGFAMGAGGHGQRYVRDVASGMRAAKPDAAAEAPPPAASPAQSAGPAVAPAPVPAESVATGSTAQAEEALLTPAPLTALDRVAEIDGRLAAIAEQTAKGATDAQAQDLATESVALAQERDSITSTWPKAVPGADTSLSTEAGVRLDARYALMDADSLVTSHDENLRASPLYPPELQPRDRSRSASEMQVSGIVQKLDPARLGVSADAATGAPIVGADGLVESGNGRTIALKRVYQANGQKADDYRQFLRANAGQFGLTPEAVEGMAKPVLVRVRTTPVNRAEFARQANASTVQRMSPSEQALSDAKRMTSLAGLNPNEDGDFSSNVDFIRHFRSSLPLTEQSEMMESDGKLSTAGYRRIQNAVLARAYGDSPSLRRMTESLDNNLVNVSKALVRAAPTIAAARERMDAGTLHQADIAPDLLAAVEGLSALKEKGWTPAQELGQGDLTGPKYSPEAAALLEFLDANIRSPRRIAEFIGRYYEALEQHGDPSQPSMFGDDVPAPARADLLTKAKGPENGDTAQDPQWGIDREAAPDREGDGRQSEDAPGGGRRAEGDATAAADAGRGQQGSAEGEAASAEQGVTVEDLSGEKINRSWTAFADDSGTLGIPRAEMPQIKAEHRGAMVNFLKARGVDAVHEDVPPGDLKPTQAEFSPEKVAQAKEFTGGDRSILVSSDSHVLDGHHQWLAKLERGEPIKAIRLDAPIAELLPLVKEFPSSTQAEGATAGRLLYSDTKKAPESRLRSTAQADTGMPVADLTAIAQRVRTSMPNMPAVHTLASPAEAPAALQDYIREQGAWNDVEGALHQGDLYLFASGLRDPLHAEFVLAEHEAAHFGLRALLGPKLPLAMRTVFNGNPEIQRAVADLQRRGNLSDIEATEEVLVDMPSDQLAKLKGWRRVVSAIQGWLDSNGFDAMAQRLQGWLDGTLSDQQRADLMAADLVRAARDYVAGKVDGNPREARGLTRLYDQIGKDLAGQEKWMAREAKARGYKSMDDLLERNYGLFEKLGALWKITHADAVPMFSRARGGDAFRTAGATVVANFRNDYPLKAHADYKAAKGGDVEAAARLVQDLVKPESLTAAREQFGEGAVYVPVHAQEALGKNKIPMALAAHYAQAAGGTFDPGVVQSNKAFHTGADAMQRLIARAEFSGAVEPGKRYVLVDDVTTMGSTLADLAAYIRRNGGEVAGSVVMVNAMRGGKMQADRKTINQLEARHGDEIRQLFGFGPEQLTAAEAQYLVGFRTSDELRARVAKAGRERGGRLSAKGVPGGQGSSGEAGEQADTLRAEIVARGGSARRRADGQDGEGNGDQTPRLSRGGNSTPPPGSGLPPNRWQQLKARVNALTSAENVDKFLYEFQDKLIDLKRLRDHIQAIGGTINDLNDAYQGEELYHKRVAKRTEDFLSGELKPLLADMRSRGITLAQFEQYLHARHAPEANKELSFRNPNQQMIDAGKAAADAQIKQLELALQRAQAAGTAVAPIEKALDQAMRERDRWNGAQAFKGTEVERLSLSGMSDADAAAIMAAQSPRRAADMKALAARVDAINAKTLDALQSYGLMDAQTLQAWRSTYQHYVPLHRDEAHPDSASHPIGQGYSVKGDAGKRRAGSNAKVTHILGHIAMQREAALTRGEKNMVGQKLYLMAAQNPDPDWWQVDRPPKTRTVDSSTGLVVERVDPLYKNRPNVIMVRIAGADAAIVFNERNERAARLAESLRNLDAGDLHYVLGWASKATRWFASVNTQYNPVFGVINFARDVQGALLNLGSTPLKGQELQVAKHMLPALRSIYQDLRAVRGGGTSGQAGGQWGRLWDEMQNAGGTTGYRDLYADPKDRAESLEKAMAALERGKTSQFVHGVLDWLSDYNETMEGATRLAAYKAALDMGMSQPKAASLAKNLTVNFNRKGRQAREIGALYAFFNAAVQGTARMMETLRGPTGKKVMLGGVLLGAMNALIGLAMMGGDDGEENGWMKIPEFVRERSLVIPLGREDFVAIPLPLGFNVLPNLGRKAVEAMSGLSKKSTGAQLGEMLGMAVNAFNPFGAPSELSGAQLALMLSPTVTDPGISLLANKDWTGKPIFRENTNTADPVPGHLRSKDTASTPAKAASLWLNKMSGGTDYRPGAISWTPDQIDFVIGQLTGGVGRELMKVNQMVAAPFTGDELPAHKVPLLGRLYGNVRGASAESGDFYENIRELNELENELKGRAQDGGDVEGLRAKEPLVGLIGRGAAAERQIQQLRKQRNVATKNGDAARVKEINEQIGEVMKDLNREVARGRK